MLKYVIKYVMDECPEEMAFFNQFIEKGLLDKLNNIVTSDFGKITYTEAVELLKNCGKSFEYPVEWGIDLQTEHERYLTEEIFKNPLHPYTKALLSSVPQINKTDKKIILKGDLPSPANPPKGCKFHTRCPYAMEKCKTCIPKESGIRHKVRCFIYD